MPWPHKTLLYKTSQFYPVFDLCGMPKSFFISRPKCKQLSRKSQFSQGDLTILNYHLTKIIHMMFELQYAGCPIQNCFVLNDVWTPSLENASFIEKIKVSNSSILKPLLTKKCKHKLFCVKNLWTEQKRFKNTQLSGLAKVIFSNHQCNKWVMWIWWTFHLFWLFLTIL